MKIEILLAVFNGEKHIKEQLNSIFSQTVNDWKVTVRDDGCSDNTMKIVNDFILKFPQKISVLDDGKGHLGSTLSFSSLLENSTGQYLFLCDQDDVWFENKLEICLEEMFKLEEDYGDIPLLVFTDLRVVDQNLNSIANSFLESQKLDPTIINSAVKLAAMNVVAGCTTLLNKSSLEFILPINSNKIIHDQWIAVNIAHFGKISYLPQATLMYRQHSNNVLGSLNIGMVYFMKKIFSPVKQLYIYKSLLFGLKFRINVFEFLYYKMLFTVKRLIK